MISQRFLELFSTRRIKLHITLDSVTTWERRTFSESSRSILSEEESHICNERVQVESASGAPIRRHSAEKNFNCLSGRPRLCDFPQQFLVSRDQDVAIQLTKSCQNMHVFLVR
jgi:hypothetical protein